jgi:PAT family beta-lactamase induction signal transducer AmpG
VRNGWRERYATIPTALAGPIPGNAESISGGAVFRLTTPSTAFPAAAAPGEPNATTSTAITTVGATETSRRAGTTGLSAARGARCAKLFLAPPRPTPEHCPVPDAPPIPPERPPNAVAAVGASALPRPARSKRALLWVSSTYFGEGLPWSFLHQMGTEYLTAIGASQTQIGSTSLLHLAVTFKFAWSPIVDLFGKRRTWVIALQILLGLGMFAVAAIAPSRNLTVFWALLGVLAVVHATHDIACDGFYLQTLDKAAQALFAGVRIAAFRGAMIVGASALVYLAGQTSWALGFGGAAVLMILVALVNAAMMPRSDAGVARGSNASGVAGAAAASPLRPSAPPTTAVSRARRFWQAYASFLTQPQAGLVLSFMFFYKLGDIMMFAMSKPLLRDIGIDTSHRGILNGIGTAAFIVGSIFGGALIAQRGIARCLAPMTLFQNLAIPLYIGLAVLRPRFGAIIPVVIFEQFAAGIGAAAHTVFLMRRTRAAFSASHYAFATAIVALGSTLAGFASGPLNEQLGHPWFFTVAFLASWPSLVLVLFVPKTDLDPAPPSGADPAAQPRLSGAAS